MNQQDQADAERQRQEHEHKRETKRRQLVKRGWSEARINQYMKDWHFHIPPTKSPHRVKYERRS